MQRADFCIHDVAADSAISIIIVPSDEWTDVVREEWAASARDDDPGLNADYAKSGQRAMGWLWWCPEEPASKPLKWERSGNVAQAVCTGRHCLGVAPDLGWLPLDLVRAADYVLTLPQLAALDLKAVIEEVYGSKPLAELPSLEGVDLDPRALRLAHRRGQTADAYVGRLDRLLKRDAGMTMPVSSGPTGTPLVTRESLRDGPTLDRLHGMDKAVEWGRALIRDVSAFKAGALPWSAVDRGACLEGPPGVGKTLFARALATSGGMPLVCGSYASWLGTGTGGQGDILRSMRQTFASAHLTTPCVLFIDEVDSFPNRDAISTRYSEWYIPVVNALLAELDGTQDRSGIIVLAACNHARRLDPAMLRSGRLDRLIRIDAPGQAALAAILREHLAANELPGIPLTRVALAAAGATGADCERVVRSARRHARDAGRNLQIADLMEALDGDGATPEQLRVAAVHEAGHALALCVLRPGELEAISLSGRRAAGGLTATSTPPGVVIAADVHRQLQCLLAGRAAEETLLGVVSAGSGGGPDSDLGLATKLALTAVTAWGFGEAPAASRAEIWGVAQPPELVWLGLPDSSDVAAMLTSDPEVGTEVSRALGRAFADARALMVERRTALEQLAKAVEKRRALSGLEAEAIVARHQPEKPPM